MFTKRYINDNVKNMANMNNRLSFWINAARGYSFPMSIMSAGTAFVFGLIDKGDIILGLISIIGVLFAHAGVNLFDDLIDYLIAKRKIKKGLKNTYDLQYGKCEYLLSGKTTLKNLIFVIVLCFSIALMLGAFLFLKTGIIVLYITLFAGIICILYPFLSYIALGELAVGITFGPLLYTGVYFVMTNSISYELLLLSISTTLLTIGLLHAHMFLDIDFDNKNEKKTLCSLAKNKEQAVNNQVIIMFLAYMNIIGLTFCVGLSKLYLITFLSLPTGIILYKLMKDSISKEKEAIKPNIFFGRLEKIENFKDIDKKNFMIKFMVARNVMVEFTILLCIAKFLTEIL